MDLSHQTQEEYIKQYMSGGYVERELAILFSTRMFQLCIEFKEYKQIQSAEN